MLILFAPVTVRLPPSLAPTLSLPVPLRAFVPAVVKAPAQVTVLVVFSPWPVFPTLPPPVMLFRVIAPEVVKVLAIFTPWLVAPVPPLQLRNVTVPEDPVVQAEVLEKPCELAAEAVLVPVIPIVPEVLTIPFVVAIRTPTPAPEPEAAPVNEIAALLVAVEIMPPEILIPFEAVLLAPPVPLSVIAPPAALEVDIVPLVKEIP